MDSLPPSNIWDSKIERLTADVKKAESGKRTRQSHLSARVNAYIGGFLAPRKSRRQKDAFREKGPTLRPDQVITLKSLKTRIQNLSNRVSQAATTAGVTPPSHTSPAAGTNQATNARVKGRDAPRPALPDRRRAATENGVELGTLPQQTPPSTPPPAWRQRLTDAGFPVDFDFEVPQHHSNHPPTLPEKRTLSHFLESIEGEGNIFEKWQTFHHSFPRLAIILFQGIGRHGLDEMKAMAAQSAKVTLADYGLDGVDRSDLPAHSSNINRRYPPEVQALIQEFTTGAQEGAGNLAEIWARLKSQSPQGAEAVLFALEHSDITGLNFINAQAQRAPAAAPPSIATPPQSASPPPPPSPEPLFTPPPVEPRLHALGITGDQIPVLATLPSITEAQAHQNSESEKRAIQTFHDAVKSNASDLPDAIAALAAAAPHATVSIRKILASSTDLEVALSRIAQMSLSIANPISLNPLATKEASSLTISESYETLHLLVNLTDPSECQSVVNQLHSGVVASLISHFPKSDFEEIGTQFQMEGVQAAARAVIIEEFSRFATINQEFILDGITEKPTSDRATRHIETYLDTKKPPAVRYNAFLDYFELQDASLSRQFNEYAYAVNSEEFGIAAGLWDSSYDNPKPEDIEALTQIIDIAFSRLVRDRKTRAIFAEIMGARSTLRSSLDRVTAREGSVEAIFGEHRDLSALVIQETGDKPLNLQGMSPARAKTLLRCLREAQSLFRRQILTPKFQIPSVETAEGVAYLRKILDETHAISITYPDTRSLSEVIEQTSENMNPLGSGSTDQEFQLRIDRLNELLKRDDLTIANYNEKAHEIQQELIRLEARLGEED